MRLEKEKNVVADQVYPIIVVHLVIPNGHRSTSDIRRVGLRQLIVFFSKKFHVGSVFFSSRKVKKKAPRVTKRNKTFTDYSSLSIEALEENEEEEEEGEDEGDEENEDKEEVVEEEVKEEELASINSSSGSLLKMTRPRIGVRVIERDGSRARPV